MAVGQSCDNLSTQLGGTVKKPCTTGVTIGGVGPWGSGVKLGKSCDIDDWRAWDKVVVEIHKAITTALGRTKDKLSEEDMSPKAVMLRAAYRASLPWATYQFPFREKPPTGITVPLADYEVQIKDTRDFAVVGCRALKLLLSALDAWDIPNKDLTEKLDLWEEQISPTISPVAAGIFIGALFVVGVYIAAKV